MQAPVKRAGRGAAFISIQVRKTLCLLQLSFRRWPASFFLAHIRFPSRLPRGEGGSTWEARLSAGLPIPARTITRRIIDRTAQRGYFPNARNGLRAQKRGIVMRERLLVVILGLAALFTLALADGTSSAQQSQRTLPAVCNCKGYDGPGGPCYAGPGGPAYDGPGGPAYRGPGGACYAGPGGPAYDGPGGPAYSGPGGPMSRAPGGPAYDGPGGPAYRGPGGPCYAGPGGPCYSGPGGDGKRCPPVCR